MQKNLAIPAELQQILGELERAGYESALVGGCVRDTLLGREPKDWDVATEARPDQIQKIFPDTISVGAAFGVIVVKTPRGPVEVASFREDGDYLDGRRPESIRYSDMAGDAKRRDFTVNALYYTPSRGVIDLVGGLKDLKARVIRCVGDPAARFAEDKLRLLRAVRFARVLGFAIESKTAAALRAEREALRAGKTSVSAERVLHELQRLWSVSPAGEGLRLLSHSGLHEPIFPEIAWDAGILARLSRAREPLTLWTALSVAGGAALLERMRVPKDTQKLCARLREETPNLASLPRQRLGVARLYLLEAPIQELLAYHDFLHGRDDALYAWIDAQSSFLRTHPELAKPAVTGADLIKQGMRPGKEMGDKLHELRLQQLENA